jgi:EAL domain-containing protein (putative c-di-GMP-specific phosphodiesterase class I)
MIELGRGLGMTVVAEGVETVEQLMLLRFEHCHQIQGYLTGMPMPFAELAALVAAARHRDGTPASANEGGGRIARVPAAVAANV